MSTQTSITISKTMNIMNPLRAASIVLLMGFIGLACDSNSSGAGSASGKGVESIQPLEAMGLIQNDFAVLLDVREEAELKASGLAASADWVPMSTITVDGPQWKTYVSKLEKNKKIVIYCAQGGRARKVATKLKALGFQVANMGGFDSWKSAGLPVKKY